VQSTIVQYSLTSVFASQRQSVVPTDDLTVLFTLGNSQATEEKWCLGSDAVVHAPRKFAGHSVLLDLSDIRASE